MRSAASGKNHSGIDLSKRVDALDSNLRLSHKFSPIFGTLQMFDSNKHSYDYISEQTYENIEHQTLVL
jgi:hypothetical protein